MKKNTIVVTLILGVIVSYGYYHLSQVGTPRPEVIPLITEHDAAMIEPTGPQLPAIAVAQIEPAVNNSSGQATIENWRGITCEMRQQQKEAWQRIQSIYPRFTNEQLCSVLYQPGEWDREYLQKEVDYEATGMIADIMFGNDPNIVRTTVPDLRYNLDPSVITNLYESQLTREQMEYKVMVEYSPEAAMALAKDYYNDDEPYSVLMLRAAGYSQKPGPLWEAYRRASSLQFHTSMSEEEKTEIKRIAFIKGAAYESVLYDLEAPGAEGFAIRSVDPGTVDDIKEYRRYIIANLNAFSLDANGTEWWQ